MLERGAAPADVGQLVARQGEAQRILEVVGPAALDRLLRRRRRVGVGQSPAATLDPGQRRPGVRTDGVQTGAKEGRPVVRIDGVQGRDDVFEGVALRRPFAVVMTEEAFGEIIQRLAAVGALADQGVGVQPDQQAFAVVVAGAAHP